MDYGKHKILFMFAYAGLMQELKINALGKYLSMPDPNRQTLLCLGLELPYGRYFSLIKFELTGKCSPLTGSASRWGGAGHCKHCSPIRFPAQGVVVLSKSSVQCLCWQMPFGAVFAPCFASAQFSYSQTPSAKPSRDLGAGTGSPPPWSPHRVQHCPKSGFFLKSLC